MSTPHTPPATPEERIYLNKTLTANAKLLALWMMNQPAQNNASKICRRLSMERTTFYRAWRQLTRAGIGETVGRNESASGYRVLRLASSWRKA